MKQIKKIYKYDLKFDSKLELFFYELLKENKIKFDFQVKYILQPSFKYNKTTIREMTLTVDFDFINHGRNLIIDTKGFQRPDNILKWKIIKHKLKNVQPIIHLPKNQKQCKELIDLIKKM